MNFRISQFIVLLSAFAAWVPLSGQPPATSSKISAVTVFLNGAQVSRQADVSLKAGEQTLRLVGLTNLLDPASLQVGGSGDFVLLAVSTQWVPPDTASEPTPVARIEQLRNERQQLQDSQNLIKSQQVAYTQEMALLQNNLDLKGEQTLSATTIREAAELYRRRIAEIQRLRWRDQIRLREVQEEISQIDKRLAVLEAPRRPDPEAQPTYDLLLTVRSERSQRATIDFSYTIPGSAGWQPQYDLRVTRVDAPVELTYKAYVYQNTHEDWEGVSLTLSTGDPQRRIAPPVLPPIYLSEQTHRQSTRKNLSSLNTLQSNPTVGAGRIAGVVVDAETGEPLIGATVVFEGSTVGTFTDERGKFDLVRPDGARNIRVSYVGYTAQVLPANWQSGVIRMEAEASNLDEIVVTGEAESRRSRSRAQRQLQQRVLPAPVVAIQRRAGNVEFQIEDPYEIASGEKPKTVEIGRFEVAAVYRYFAVPKVDPNVYLTAQATGYDSLNLLDGEARLFFEGTYVGETVLQPQQAEDTLTLFLGPDRRVVVERQVIHDYRTTGFLGGKRREQRAYEIRLRNQRNEAVRVELVDQIPVSRQEDIEVEVEEKSGADLRESTGALRWLVDLKQGERSTKTIRYEVKFPRNMRVRID